MLPLVISGCCPPPQKIKPDSSLLIPAEKNTLTADNTVRDLVIENEFRGKEIDKVNLNLEVIGLE